METSRENCAICLGSMKAGDGRALYTAECSHIFHFNCIATNVQQGNHICPICCSTWSNLPSQLLPGMNLHPLSYPSQPPVGFLNPFPYVQQPFFPPPAFHSSPFEFADDEPLPAPSTEEGLPSSSTPAPQLGEGITVKAWSEYPALSKSEQHESFSVLAGISAPALSPEATDRARAPLDLVAVLDVSGSMEGNKIRLLKQAVNFVVDNLSTSDRFSIVTFSTGARRVTPLRRMTEAGRTEMAQAVNSLRASGATNIIAGLRKAVQILDQRRMKNPVASIILLSDGQDNQNPPGGEGFYNALGLLPASIRSRNLGNSHSHSQNDVVPVPVHTFGFGSDHDARALHAVADGSGGSFSYIESLEIIQDAFAQCLGGLLSVVAQDVRIQLNTVSSGVRILSISSGRYPITIDNNYRNHGEIVVGDLYAEEEKKFLIYLLVPQETDSSTTQLLEIQCSYKDPLSKESLVSEMKRAEIRRPSAEDLSEADRQVCIEVDREKNRVSVMEGIAQAQAMAERGELDGARSLLEQRRQNLLSSVSAQARDSHSEWLDREVIVLRQQMASKAKFEAGGRAYALSRGSAHMYQRASTQALSMEQQQQQCSGLTPGAATSGSAVPVSGVSFYSAPGAQAYGAATPEEMGYQTSLMRKMVTKSQQLRKSTKQEEEVAPSSKPSMP